MTFRVGLVSVTLNITAPRTEAFGPLQMCGSWALVTPLFITTRRQSLGPVHQKIYTSVIDPLFAWLTFFPQTQRKSWSLFGRYCRSFTSQNVS